MLAESLYTSLEREVRPSNDGEDDYVVARMARFRRLRVVEALDHWCGHAPTPVGPPPERGQELFF